MGAGTQFPANLNMDAIGIKTPAMYDAVLDEWLMLNKTMVMSAGGVLVPLTLDTNNRLQASVKDSALPTGGSTSANQTALNNLLGAIDAAAVTDPTVSAVIIALLKGLLKQHQGSGTVKDQVDTVDRAARILGKVTADDGAFATLGALASAAVTDPAVNANAIALLKGILQQLQTGPNLMTLSASDMELYGANISERPAASAVSKGATFTIVDSTGNFDSYISDGTNWTEV